MSATLVETCMPPPQSCRLPHSSLTISPPTVVEERWATQLAHLASQHHLSEYSRLKFGAQGSPVPYVPLTLQMPDHLEALQKRQHECAQDEPWWPCSTSDTASLISTEHCRIPTVYSTDLQGDISDAMASSLLSSSVLLVAQPASSPQVKTSSTHPINISTLIPPELLPLISSHLLLSAASGLSLAPTVFEISSSFSLDRLIASFPPYSLPIAPPPQWKMNHKQISPLPIHPHLRTRSSVSEALQAAINCGFSQDTREKNSSSHLVDASATPPNINNIYNHTNTSFSFSLTITEESEHYPANVPLHTVPWRPISPTSGTPTHNLDASPSTNLEPAPVVNIHDSPEQSNISPAEAHGMSPRLPKKTLDRKHVNLVQRPSTPRLHPSQLPAACNPNVSTTPFVLGNLLLSSCPGKKVRLNGPVKGRSGVCRDLKTDLRRMRELGVRCIICCLDDTELDFLGVSWLDYAQTAQIVGMDVLRIPTPEGLAPLTPASIDVHLTRLIDTYTLNGVPMLVHCRGGVGRAGVVACCWMLKLGLCGWIEPDIGSRTDATADFGFGLRGLANVNTGAVRKDTLRLVERVIEVVRKRRSVKAVETYEQVKFLVNYVEYLRKTETHAA